jgi:hypothetical protein
VSIQAVGWVLDHSRATHDDRLVLLSIGNHCDKYGRRAWPSYATIAEEARIDRRSAIRCVSRLERGPELTVRRGAGPIGDNGRATNLYELTEMVTACHHLIPPDDAGDGDSDGDRPVTRTVVEPSRRTVRAREGAPRRAEPAAGRKVGRGPAPAARGPQRPAQRQEPPPGSRLGFPTELGVSLRELAARGKGGDAQRPEPHNRSAPAAGRAAKDDNRERTARPTVDRAALIAELRKRGINVEEGATAHA